MLSEAAHSVADTVTEVCLFVALRRGARPCSPSRSSSRPCRCCGRWRR
ncbi:MAG: hypothetical protein ACKVZ6_15955 [Kineosporiaceae bacterium]